MQCGEAHVGCRVVPRLLGVYELELHEVMFQCIGSKLPFDLFVDIGAAEGYYAVGLARYSSIPRVIAYESDATGQRIIREASRLNGVEERIEVKGFCDSQSLRESLFTAERPLILCDIEGAEANLLEPESVPQLLKATILVELHEQFVPGVGKILKERFENTHDIREVFTKPRRVEDVSVKIPVMFRILLKKWFLMTIADGRGDTQMSWLYMSPLARNYTGEK